MFVVLSRFTNLKRASLDDPKEKTTTYSSYI
jgi:hypothetical protein